MTRCPPVHSYGRTNPGPCGPTACNGECDPDVEQATPPEPAHRRSGPCCDAAATLANLFTDGRWLVERTETTWTSKRLPDDPDDLGVDFTCPCGVARRASRKPETCVCGRPYGLYSAQHQSTFDSWPSHDR